MSTQESEYWEAQRMYQAVQEVCIPFACTTAGGVYFRFGLAFAIPAGLIVYFVFMLKATARRRDAARAHQEFKAANEPKDAA